MITVIVKSPIMEVTRNFKKDNPSITFLKRVKRLHVTYAKHQAGQKPKSGQFLKTKDYRAAIEKYNEAVACGLLPLKISVEHHKTN